MTEPQALDDDTMRATLLIHTYSIQAIWTAQIKLLRKEPAEYLDQLEEQLLAAAPGPEQPNFRAAYERHARNLVNDLRDACAKEGREARKNIVDPYADSTAEDLEPEVE